MRGQGIRGVRGKDRYTPAEGYRLPVIWKDHFQTFVCASADTEW